MGKLKLAEEEFRNAIKLKADYGDAYQGLSEVVKFSPDDPLIKQTVEQVHADCDRNKWLSAEEAVEYGCVDKILAHMPDTDKKD